MPLFGTPNVDAMKAKRDVKGLFRLMTTDEGDLGKRAAEALVDMGATVVKPLLALVEKAQDGDKAQKAATRVLRAIGSPVVEPLLAALQLPNERGQLVAVHTLGTMSDPRSGEAFLDLLRDRTSGRWLTRAVAAGYVGRFVGIRAQEPLLNLLRESDSVTVLMGGQAYAKALGDVGDGQAIETLAVLTRARFPNSYVDSPAQLRASAAEALGKIAGRLKDASEKAVAERALTELLKDSSMALRGYGALALGQIIGHNAVEPLLAALEDTDPLVRSAAAFGLRGSLDPRKVEPLIARLSDPDKDMRVNAVEGLGPGNDPRALEPLIACLRDQEPAVRHSAVSALLFFVSDGRIVQPLVASLSDVSAEVRSQAALVLAFCGQAAVDPLIDSLSDPSPDVRWQAAFSLGHLKDARAVAPLIAALQDTDRAVRYHCVQALGQIRTPQAITVVQAALGDPDDLVRQAAQEAVQSMSRAPQPEEPGAAAPQVMSQSVVPQAAEFPALSPQPGMAVDAAPPEPAVGVLCAHCGTMNRAGRRYCGQCGSSLAETGAPAASSAPKVGAQGQSQAPAPTSLPGQTSSQTDTVRLLREIVEHVRSTPDDDFQQDRLAVLVGQGTTAAPAVIGAIWSIVRYEREQSRLENAGLLCEALGRIGGGKAFDALVRFAGLDFTVPANHAVRLGAVRGLGLLGDPRAEQTLTSAGQDPDEQVRDAASLALGQLQQRQDAAPSAPMTAATPPAAPEVAPTERPVDTTAFYHEEWNFSIAYPAGWQVIYENEPAGSWVIPIAVASGETGGGRPCFMVNARRGEILQGSANAPVYGTGPDGQFMKMPSTPEEYIPVNRTSVQNAFPGFQFISGEAIRLADKPATRLVYSYDGQKSRTTEESITLFGVGVTFQFICEMPSARRAEFQPVFQQILSSFRIGRAPQKQAGTAETSAGAAEVEQTPRQWYNQGADLYRSGEFRQALTMFERACASGEYQMQAAYARSLCQRQLGLEIQIPPELADRAEETGPVYLATNLACYLAGKGHAVALAKQGRTSEVQARIDGAEYVVSIVQGFGFGGVFQMAWRKEADKTIPLTDSNANPQPSAADRLVISTLEQLSSLPPQPLPEAGFGTALEAVASLEPTVPASPAVRPGAANGLGILGDERDEQTLTSAQASDRQARDAATHAPGQLQQPQVAESPPDEAAAPVVAPATVDVAPAPTANPPADTEPFYHGERNSTVAHPAGQEVISPDEPEGARTMQPGTGEDGKRSMEATTVTCSVEPFSIENAALKTRFDPGPLVALFHQELAGQLARHGLSVQESHPSLTQPHFSIEGAFVRIDEGSRVARYLLTAAAGQAVVEVEGWLYQDDRPVRELYAKGSQAAGILGGEAEGLLKKAASFAARQVANQVAQALTNQ